MTDVCEMWYDLRDTGRRYQVRAVLPFESQGRGQGQAQGRDWRRPKDPQRLLQEHQARKAAAQLHEEIIQGLRPLVGEALDIYREALAVSVEELTGGGGFEAGKRNPEATFRMQYLKMRLEIAGKVLGTAKSMMGTAGRAAGKGETADAEDEPEDYSGVQALCAGLGGAE